MDIIGQASASGDVFVIKRVEGNSKEATSIINDLRREVVSGRTRWFAVVGAGVDFIDYPDVMRAASNPSVELDRGEELPLDTTEYRLYKDEHGMGGGA